MIRDALLLKNATVMTSFGTVMLRRPSVADVIETTEVASKRPETLYAHLVWRHVLEDGDPAFRSLEEVLELDGIKVFELGREIERLYGEGRD